MRCVYSNCNDQAEDDSNYCGNHQWSPLSVPKYQEERNAPNDSYKSGYRDRNDSSVGNSNRDRDNDYTEKSS